MHFGVILPNYGKDSTPDGIRRVAEAAEELGFDSVWATEHIIVGPEAVYPYGRVYSPLVTLGWIAGWTEQIGLGTSIVLVPLHNPMQLAKEVSALQELSAGRFTLGVGMGWHRDEFEFMGVEFEGRGRRGDEAIRLMRALHDVGDLLRVAQGRRAEADKQLAPALKFFRSVRATRYLAHGERLVASSAELALGFSSPGQAGG